MINIQPYSNPRYFVILFIALLPLIIGLYHGRRFKTYEAFVSLLFLFLMFKMTDTGSHHCHAMFIAVSKRQIIFH